MKKYRVQVTVIEIFECWVEAEDWEEAEDVGMAEYHADHVDLISSSETAEVVEEDDECEM